jgi:hypothetical protein
VDKDSCRAKPPGDLSGFLNTNRRMSVHSGKMDAEKNMRRLTSFLSKSIPWILLALSLLPLAAWACLGFFTRYLADDYSTSSVLLKKGFWQMQAYWYHAWSGRYSFTFLVSLVELAGVRMVPWIVWIALLAWFLSLFWALKQIFGALSIPVEKKWLGVLTAVILFGAAKSLPNASEVLFWQTGILTYQVSNILLGFFLALFLKRFFSQAESPKVAWWEYCAAFVIAIAIGGFSETWIVIQVALITLGLLYFFFFYKNSLSEANPKELAPVGGLSDVRDSTLGQFSGIQTSLSGKETFRVFPENRNSILGILFMAYLGSWCSLAAIVKAPGNLTRNAGLAGLSLQSVSAALLASVKDVPVFLFEWMRDNTVLVIMLLLAGVFIGLWASAPATKEKARRELCLGLSLLGVACVLLSAGFFPAFVAWGARPPDRAVFVPMFIFVWAYVLFGFFAGRFFNAHLKADALRTGLQGLLLILLVVAMGWTQVRTAYASLQLIPTLQTYVQLWDQRDAFLRQASLQHKGDVVIPSLRRNPAFRNIQASIWMVGELVEDKHNWINQAAASYYRVRSISGK